MNAKTNLKREKRQEKALLLFDNSYKIGGCDEPVKSKNSYGDNLDFEFGSIPEQIAARKFPVLASRYVCKVIKNSKMEMRKAITAHVS